MLKVEKGRGERRHRRLDERVCGPNKVAGSHPVELNSGEI